MNKKKKRPYGAWQSPISADLLASQGISLGWLQVSGKDVYWVETRPFESGRYVIVRRSADGNVNDVTARDFNARTLVHEYGGGMYVSTGSAVYFSNHIDQRLYRVDRLGVTQPITSEPPADRSLRYADGFFTSDERHLVCVREIHGAGGDVTNQLVVLNVDGAGEPGIIATGNDFYSSPRISPDGKRIAWLCWNNPQMPWDGTELWVAMLDGNFRVSEKRLVAGGTQESVFQPEWSPDMTLYFISDRTGWWNLYREVEGRVEPVVSMNAEFGQPQWLLGYSRYGFLADGRIAAIYSQKGFDHLGLIYPRENHMEPVSCEYTSFEWLRTDGTLLWLIGGSPTTSSEVFSLDPSDGSIDVVKSSTTCELDSTHFSQPIAIEFPTESGQTSHALYYPPESPDFEGGEDELPPLIVISHGGPTAATKSHLSWSIQFWTSRGFAVVDVNYRGSTGYGRDYRELLRGSWGIVDVEDCINAAKYLVGQRKVNDERIAIRGRSAGGYTALRALTWKSFFTVGVSYFGIADLERLAKDTHKFEARYLDYLIGPYPERKDLYLARSPINSVERLNCPVILFQGLEDKVVPPSQSEIMVQALKKKGVPFAYLAFEGEQHGFRKAETIIRCAKAELYFYGRIFGFTPADSIEPVDIVNFAQDTNARAVYFKAPGEVELREERIRKQEGTVLVESRLMGISAGTEMLLFRGEMPSELDSDLTIASLSGNLAYPVKYGYINTGSTPAGARVFSFFPHQDRFYAKEEELTPLPDGMLYEDAVFLASMETAVTVLQDAAPVVGDDVLVLGQGVIGLLIAEILKRSHFGRVITLDRYERRRHASAEIGCLTLSPDDSSVSRKIREMTAGRGVDVAVNVSGTGEALDLALESLAFGGTVVEASWYGERKITLNLGTAFHRRRLNIKSSQVSTIDPSLTGGWTKRRRMEVAMELIESIRPGKYITHTMRLHEAQQAYTLLRDHTEETIQVVLEP